MDEKRTTKTNKEEAVNDAAETNRKLDSEFYSEGEPAKDPFEDPPGLLARQIQS